MRLTLMNLLFWPLRASILSFIGSIGLSDILAVAGPMIGSAMSSGASSDAANAQVQAANQASQTQMQMFNQTQANLQPWMSGGGNALSKLQQLMGLGGSGESGGSDASMYNLQDWQQATRQAFQQAGIDPAGADYWANQAYQRYISDPAWQSNPGAQAGSVIVPLSSIRTLPGASGSTGPSDFGSLTKPFSMADYQQSPYAAWLTQQGLGAINNTASSLGVTGNTLKALSDYSQKQAMGDYWNQYNAYTNDQANLFSRLFQLSSSGQNAAANVGSMGTSTANSIAQNQIGAGNAQAAGMVGSANALSSGINGALQNYMLNSILSSGGIYG